MASTKAYLDYVLEQLDAAEEIAFRPMMGEYVLYCRGKVVGGVYDDRLLLKPTPGALRLLAEAGLAAETELRMWTGGNCCAGWWRPSRRSCPRPRESGHKGQRVEGRDKTCRKEPWEPSSRPGSSGG